MWSSVGLAIAVVVLQFALALPLAGAVLASPSRGPWGAWSLLAVMAGVPLALAVIMGLQSRSWGRAIRFLGTVVVLDALLFASCQVAPVLWR